MHTLIFFFMKLMTAKHNSITIPEISCLEIRKVYARVAKNLKVTANLYN